MDKGHKEGKKIEHFIHTSGEMKNKDFGYAFGIHQRLYEQQGTD